MKREREAKAMVNWMLRVVFEENLLSEIGRACLIEIGCKTRWWSRCGHINLYVWDNGVGKSYFRERSECEWNCKPRNEF